MARPKKYKSATTQITIRCPKEIKRGVKILGILDGYKTTSEMIVEIVSGFVEENKSRIEAFEKSWNENHIKKPQYTAPQVATDESEGVENEN